jgi:hypothetical protein
LVVKYCSPNRAFEEEAYVKQSQDLEVYQKETHACRYKKTLYGFKQLGVQPVMHNRSVVKTFYDRDSVSEWLLRISG